MNPAISKVCNRMWLKSYITIVQRQESVELTALVDLKMMFKCSLVRFHNAEV